MHAMVTACDVLWMSCVSLALSPYASWSMRLAWPLCSVTVALPGKQLHSSVCSPTRSFFLLTQSGDVHLPWPSPGHGDQAAIGEQGKGRG